MREIKAKPHVLRDMLGTIVTALIIAFVLKTVLFQPFTIPSSSMEPTLRKGDYIIVSKFAYGYGNYAASPFKLSLDKGPLLQREPKRGDVIVFKAPGKNVYFVKRLTGLPGDRVQMRNGFLFINDNKQYTQKLADDYRDDGSGNLLRVERYREQIEGEAKPHMLLGTQLGSKADDTGIYHVPEGHYFFIGDNRDNSLDSRFPASVGGIGYIPASHLVGRAEFVLLSVKTGFTLYKPWTWGYMRKNRFFKGLR